MHDRKRGLLNYLFVTEKSLQIKVQLSSYFNLEMMGKLHQHNRRRVIRYAFTLRMA